MVWTQFGRHGKPVDRHWLAHTRTKNAQFSERARSAIFGNSGKGPWVTEVKNRLFAQGQSITVSRWITIGQQWK